MFRRLRSQKGAALVEYSLLVAGIALVGAAAVAVFGHKTTDMMSAMAAVMPGAHADDNAPMVSGKIIETSAGAAGEDSGGNATTGIGLDIGTILDNSDGTQQRLGNNLGADTTGGTAGGVLADLVLEAG